MSTDNKSINWYDNNAEEYASRVRDTKGSLLHSCYEKPAMMELVPKIKGKKVLSLGCGSGEDSQSLKDLGVKESVGVDISKNLINIAKRNHPKCSFEVMDMEKLSFPDNYFDFAYSSLAIHYVEHWNKVFAEAYRVLKPGCSFVFSCGHPTYSAMDKSESIDAKNLTLSVKKSKNKDTVEITGDYFKHRRIQGAHKNMKVTIWHKPIGEICSEINGSGFLILSIVEPKPTLEMKRLSLKKYLRLNKIPYFLIFKLIKPL